MKKQYTSQYNPAVKELSDLIIKEAYDGLIPPHILAKITPVLDGVEVTDKLLLQKDNVINQKDQLLFQKEQLLIQKDKNLEQLRKNGVVDTKEEFIYLLNKLSPEAYSADFSKWSDKLPMKKHVVNNDIQVMEKNIKIYKKQLEEKEQENIKKEFINSLHKLYPNAYSADSREWTDKLPMKKHLDENNFEIMVKNTLYYKSEIKKNEIKELEEAKKLKEENLEKDHLLAKKEELLLAKELENKKLLTQKEEELKEKSFAKNQVLDLKEKEALNLKIEFLIKQLEFKDKALEDAHVINELQEKLLAFQNLSKHDETLQLELSVIHFKVEESILGGNVEEMKELSKYLNELIKNPIEKDESLEISKLLALNESPIVVKENSVNNPVEINNNAIISNFIDINHINTTHSVYQNGEDSYSIIQEENFN